MQLSSSGVDRSSISPFQGDDLGFKFHNVVESPDWSTTLILNQGLCKFDPDECRTKGFNFKPATGTL